MKRCSYCGKSNPDAEYTCARCYAALEAIASKNTNYKQDKSAQNASDTLKGDLNMKEGDSDGYTS